MANSLKDPGSSTSSLTSSRIQFAIALVARASAWWQFRDCSSAPDGIYPKDRGEAKKKRYSLMVRTTLFSGRLLLAESLSCCLTISSNFGNVVSSPFGTMCTTL